MKVTVNVDCSPEEARRFLGLPDLTPVHRAYVDNLERAVSSGMTSDTVAELMKSWGPMTEVSLDAWGRMIEGLSPKR